jgi:hypothetical protein
MPSERQRNANRRNDALGGPKTPERRAAVRFNALTHGLSSAAAVLPRDDSAGFDRPISQHTRRRAESVPADAAAENRQNEPTPLAAAAASSPLCSEAAESTPADLSENGIRFVSSTAQPEPLDLPQPPQTTRRPDGPVHGTPLAAA